MEETDRTQGEGGTDPAEPEPDILLVGCVKGKLEWASRVAAKDLYVSPLWRCRRIYAERSGLPWFILSAKYGLLDPEAKITWYDLALGNLPAAQRRTWSQRVVDTLLSRYPSMEGRIIEIHAGKDYVDYGLETGLKAAGAIVRRPLLGVPIGGHLGWYREQGVVDEYL